MHPVTAEHPNMRSLHFEKVTHPAPPCAQNRKLLSFPTFCKQLENIVTDPCKRFDLRKVLLDALRVLMGKVSIEL